MYNLNQKGQMFILSLIILTVILVGTVVLITGTITFKQNSKYNLDALDATNLAEAGIDKAVAALNVSGGSYNGESETSLGGGSYSVTITSINSSTKLIESTGFIPDKNNPKAKRTIQIQLSKGEGISFNYGVQVGDGGLSMANNSQVNGSVYSNGNITMNNGATITGDAYVAGGTQATADQQTECITPNPNCPDYLFGKNISGENRLDIAQSFKPSQTAVINKVSLKLRKFGFPSNVIVRILGDSNGTPNKNNVLTSGTLNANLVTSEYGFADITMSPTPTLNSGTTYWIVIDTSSNTSNYWSWSMDSLQSYTCSSTPPCLAKWSPNWSASNPSWTTISGDLGFKVFMGGVITSIIGSNNPRVDGSAYANTLQNLTIGNNAYYQTQSGIVVNGSTCTNNTHCYPNSSDPAPQTMPISDANIEEWQTGAEQGGVQNGDIIGCPSSPLVRKKYVGNVTITNGCTVTVESPLWITGNLELNNGAIMKLTSSFGVSSGVIVVDGTIKLSNNGKLQGSGTSGSYLMGLSNFDSTQTDSTAIETDNGSASQILYAGKGKIILKNNASLQEVTAWKISLDNNSSVIYNSGLSNTFFSSGPAGSFSAVKGTYQLK